MKKVIKLNEEALQTIIKEALSELNYSTYRKAYNKMQKLGQYDRANNFANNYNDHYSDKDNGITSRLDKDTVYITNPNSAGEHTSAAFGQDGRMNIMGRIWGPEDAKTYTPRTNNRARINKQVSALDHFYGGKGNNPYSKNDFISEDKLSEAVSRAIKSVLNK